MKIIIDSIRSHRWYVIILGAIFLFFGARIILLRKPNTELTYTMKRENLVDTVDVSGSYTTASQTQVLAPSNGVLDQLFVANNAQAKKGDSLFHIQSTATEDQKRAAYAAYLSAKSTLDADNATLYSLQSTMFAKWKIFFDKATNSTYQNADGSPNNTSRVLTDFSTSQDDWFYAEQNYKNQQSVIAKDQAAVASTLLSYQETQSVTVTAPIGGTIVNLNHQMGDQVTAGQPFLIVADLTNPYLSAEVSEDYAMRIVPGQPVAIVFDAAKDKSFTGRVVSIDMVGSGSQGSVTYTARIAIDDGLSTLKPGMSAVATIETFRKNEVLDVPNSAIITKNNVSYVEEARSHKLLPVIVGARGLAKTEITDGLNGNAVIVTVPQL